MASDGDMMAEVVVSLMVEVLVTMMREEVV